MNSHGVVSAAGVGCALAEWIENKGPTMDLTAADIRRFSRHHGNKRYLRDTVGPIVGYQYELPYPLKEPPAARNMKSSPLYDVLQAQGAAWSSVMGWECPKWFSRDGNGMFDAVTSLSRLLAIMAVNRSFHIWQRIFLQQHYVNIYHEEKFENRSTVFM